MKIAENVRKLTKAPQVKCLEASGTPDWARTAGKRPETSATAVAREGISILNRYVQKEDACSVGRVLERLL